MKLRFRKNSLRLRVNQVEAQMLAAGEQLQEEVQFPGAARFAYTLRAKEGATPEVNFRDGVITVAAPADVVGRWAASDEVGMYFEIPPIRIAIEKDLECIDGPPEERDPHAFPRTGGGC